MSPPRSSTVPGLFGVAPMHAHTRDLGASALQSTWGVVAGACLAGTWFPHARGPALIVLTASLLVALARPRDTSSQPTAATRSSPLQVAERWAPLSLALFFVPVLTHVVAPGADMAMHAALARALRDDLPVLSPAWGQTTARAYPLGFSAWIAVFGAVVDLGTASTLASACAFALYFLALRRFLGSVLTVSYPGLLAAFLVTASWTPQAFYRWGGGPSVLALALSLCAAADLPQLCLTRGALPSVRQGAFVAVLLMAAMATHPIGASIGAACSGILWLRCCTRQPRAAMAGWVFLPVLLLMAWLSLAGPALSQRELAWIYHFRTVDENVLGDWPRWLFPATVWRALAVRVGPVLSVCFVASCIASWRHDRRVLWTSLLSIEAFGAVLAYGPELPALGFLVYPSRLMPAAVLLMAAPLSAAAQRAQERLSPRAQRAGGTLLALSALGVHVGLYQTAQPMLTHHDAALLRCLSERVPTDAVIEGAYGDATQWVPALTGRAVTHPHQHCSLFDEVEAELAHKQPTHRLVGERVSFGAPLSTPPPASKPVCQSGGARLFELAPGAP